MDKETLSNYGWIVICVLVLAVMIALATPFGEYIKDATKSTTEGFFGVNQNALGTVGIVIKDQKIGNITYKMLDGANQTFKQTDTISFRSEAEIDKFVEVKVDNEIVNAANYNVTEGSTIITFTPEYAKTLKEGEHTITIVSEDGKAECSFKIVECAIGYAVFNSRLDHETGEWYNERTVLTWEMMMDGQGELEYGILSSAITNTEVENSAFCGIQMHEIVIPNGIIYIGEQSFCHSQIESVTIPKTVTEIKSKAFAHCNLLTNIIFEGTTEQWDAIQKANDWNENIRATIVVCSNGQVQI